MSNRCAIILPTHSNYLGICKNFISLLKKNWSDCPYKIYLSYTGNIIQSDTSDWIEIYNGPTASLTECVINATKKIEADYYLCFLGDAFINTKVDTLWIENLFSLMDEHFIEYCSLMYVTNYKKRKLISKQFRYIHNSDRYSHNFVAYIATNSFIDNIVSKCKTDLDFEKYFMNDNVNDYYDNHIIVNKNYLCITPGITKGKWNRFAIKRLKKDNPEIEFENRPMESLGASVFQWVHDTLIGYFPSSLRIGIKKLLNKLTKKKFVTYK